MVGDKNIYSVVIVAAGSGLRFGTEIPKQFLDLAGRPVLRHSLDTFKSVLPQAPIVLVLSENGREIWADYCAKSGYRSPMTVLGGTTRSESVLNGLKALEHQGVPADAVVMIHDGARPLVKASTIEEIAEVFEQGLGDAAVPATPLTDTVAAIDVDRMIAGAVDRNTLMAMQTPQAFRLGDIIRAHTDYSDEFSTPTDDCGVYLRVYAEPIYPVAGDPDNIKITNPLDLAIAGLMLSNA